MATARDIPLLITSTASSSERRITPSWTVAQLKAKLEPITGIAPAAQKLTLRLPDQDNETAIEADDEHAVQIGTWRLVAYAEIKVHITTHHSATTRFRCSPFLLAEERMFHARCQWSAFCYAFSACCRLRYHDCCHAQEHVITFLYLHGFVRINKWFTRSSSLWICMIDVHKFVEIVSDTIPNQVLQDIVQSAQ